MYSWKEYVNTIKSLKVPKGMIGHIYVVDTSNEIDAVKFEVEDEGFIYKHLNLWQSERNNYAKRMDKIVAARNEIFKYAIKFNYDYVFFCDSDVIIQNNTIIQLLNNLKENTIISGFYPGMTEYGLPTPSAKLILKDKIIDFPDNLLDNQIHEVNLIGLGSVLFQKRYLQNLNLDAKGENMGICSNQKIGVSVKI